MRKIAYLLSVYLFCLLPKLQAQDIDFPLLPSEIEKYESRIRIQRLPAVSYHPCGRLQNQDTAAYIFSSDKRDCA